MIELGADSMLQVGGMATRLGEQLSGLFLLLGLAFTYTGIILHRLYVLALGFLTGAALSVLLAVFYLVSSANTAFEQTMVLQSLVQQGDIQGAVLLAGLFGGVVVGALALSLEKLIVSFIGFMVTGGIVMIALEGQVSGAIGLVAGVVGAALAWRAYVWMIILVTTVVGAGLFTIATGGAIPVFAVIFISGIVVQRGWLSIRGFDGVEGRTSSSSGEDYASSSIGKIHCRTCGARNEKSADMCRRCKRTL